MAAAVAAGGSSKLIDVPPTGTFLDPVLDPLVTPVEDLLSGLLGGLLGQGAPSTSGSTGSTAPRLEPGGHASRRDPGRRRHAGADHDGRHSRPAPASTTTVHDAPTSGAAARHGDRSPDGADPTTTTTTGPAPRRPPSSSGLLGGIVGGLTKTVGGLL